MRILHLMILTFGCALGIRAYQSLTPEARELWVSRQVYVGVMGIAVGTMITSAGALALHRWRGSNQPPLLPGHWLLFFGFAAATANGAAIGVVMARWPYDYWPDVYLALFSMSFGPTLIGLIHQSIGWRLGTMAALAFLWHLRGRIPWPWMMVFFLFLGTSASLFLGYVFALFILCFLFHDHVMTPWAWVLMRDWCKCAPPPLCSADRDMCGGNSVGSCAGCPPPAPN